METRARAAIYNHMSESGAIHAAAAKTRAAMPKTLYLLMFMMLLLDQIRRTPITGNFGAMLATPLVRLGEILTLDRDLVCPFYKAKMVKAIAAFTCAMQDSECPWYIRKPEGGMFL
ncbi:MAG: hypothetical protein U5R46_04365 [Gammaproteobacteria bacterium]|nr:hypothetical protein [Gammaproteobacteria bacterium]